MLKFDSLIKSIEIFMGQFILPFCFDRQNVQFEILKIGGVSKSMLTLNEAIIDVKEG